MQEALLAGPQAVITKPRPAASTRTFLPYIDGLRGFFGLYIAVAHLWYLLSIVAPASFPLPSRFVFFGHTAIAMFIVASGFVLGLPVVRDGQTFRGGLGTFARKRMLRILPAYYAALLISVPISWLCASLYREAVTKHDFVISALMHIFMVHNWSDHLLSSIDGPMWSVAMECDIYILFPILLVPLARRFGFVPMIAVGFAVGLVPPILGFLRHHVTDYHFASTCPWYVGLFALGYAAANVSASANPNERKLLDRVPWGIFAAVLAVATLAVIGLTPLDETDLGNGNRWLSDMLAGFAMAAQFVADAQARQRHAMTWFERFFTWRPFLLLGTFSYSYYLIHLPMIELVLAAARPGWTFAPLLALGGAALFASLIVAYALYHLVECPSMTAYRRRGDASSLHSARAVEITESGQVAVAPAAPS